MSFPLKFATALVVLAFPLLEIALLIKAGANFGFWPVLLIVVLTAFAGASIIRARGLSIFSRLKSNMDRGGGLEPLIDTFLAVTGGVLLIFPGLIGDVLGALLSIPAVRSLLVRAGAARLLAGGIVTSEIYEQRVSTRNGLDSLSGDTMGSVVIEGDYERIDDEPPQQMNTGPRP